MHKKLIISSIIIGILCIGALGYAGIPSGFFVKDAIVENDLNANKKVSVSIKGEKTISEISIFNSSEIADDGGLIYNVKSISDDKLIGSFSYMPWIEKRPIYFTLSNGDIILGRDKIFNKKDRKILPLLENNEMTVFDYEVYGNNIAIIGKNHPGTAQIDILVKNIIDGKVNIIDSYEYSQKTYPEVVYLGWGDNGKLYYDYFENNTPEIKMYDLNTKVSEIFMKNSMNPQTSPDGKKMVFEAINTLNSNDRMISELQLFDLVSYKKISKLDGSRKIFWDGKYLIVKNIDETKLIVYDLDNGQKIKEFNYNDQPYEVKVTDNGIRVKSFKFNNSIITEDEKEITN